MVIRISSLVCFIYSVVVFLFTYKYGYGNYAIDSSLNANMTNLLSEDIDFDNMSFMFMVLPQQDFLAQQINFRLQPLGFRERGYDYRYNPVFINQLPIKSITYGSFSGIFTGGVADILRVSDRTVGLSVGERVVSGLSSSSDIILLPTKLRNHQKIAYTLTNQITNHRLTYTYVNKNLPHGFSLAFSGSLRYTPQQQHYSLSPVQGMPYESVGYAFLVGKQLTQNQALSFSLLGTYQKRGLRGTVVSEVVDITSRTYNPHWGMYNDNERSTKIQSSHALFAQGNYLFTINPHQEWGLNVGIEVPLENYNTNLDWYKVSNPSPTYYRHLPSFASSKEESIRRRESWQKDENTRQINWNRLYDVNRELNLLNDLGDAQSYYYITAYHKKQFSALWSGFHKMRFGNNQNSVDMFSGVNIAFYREKNYTTAQDLLGGDYILNIYKYGNEPTQSEAQYDIENSNNRVTSGGYLGARYDISQIEYKFYQNYYVRWGNRLRLMGSWEIGQQYLQRYGHLRDGKYPNSSKGDGDVLDYMRIGLKIGGKYQFSIRHAGSINLYYLQEPPLYKDTYLYPQRSATYLNIPSKQIFSSEYNYYLDLQEVQFRTTFYLTYMQKGSSINSSFDYVEGKYNHNALHNINTFHVGIESGFHYGINRDWSLEGALCVGDYSYTNDPNIMSFINASMESSTHSKVLLTNLKVGGRAQYAGNISVNHNLPFSIARGTLSVSLSNSWLHGNYVELDPFSRSTFTENYFIQNRKYENFQNLRKQEELAAVYTFDLSLNWVRFFRKSMIGVILMAQNLHNNQFATRGYEDSHLDAQNFTRFPSRFLYHQGRRIFLLVYFRLH